MTTNSDDVVTYLTDPRFGSDSWTRSDAKSVDEDHCMQISVHACPKSVFRELAKMFPDCTSAKSSEDVRVVVMVQRASMNLLNIGSAIEDEKNILLERVCDLPVVYSCLAG